MPRQLMTNACSVSPRALAIWVRSELALSRFIPRAGGPSATLTVPPVARCDAMGNQGCEVVVAGARDVGAQIMVELVEELAGSCRGPSADALDERVEGPGEVATLADAVGIEQQAIADGEGDGVDLVVGAEQGSHVDGW